MTFEETLDVLDDWTGREVSAAVRITNEEPAPVAVFRGRLGRPRGERAGEEAEVFVPVRPRTRVDPPLGLHLLHEGFEDAIVGRDRLYLSLDDAIVELAAA